jgi:HTH-type transcriptional repressor of NAD biosynthesis genes
MFSDTNNLITLFAAECMGKTSKVLSQMAHVEDYDLVIMLDIDVPWVYDPLRLNFSTERRQETNELLKFLCKAHGVKYHLISGPDYDERFKTAVKMVQNLLQGKPNEHTGDES